MARLLAAYPCLWHRAALYMQVQAAVTATCKCFRENELCVLTLSAVLACSHAIKKKDEIERVAKANR